MPFKPPGNRAIGYLSTAYTSGSGSIVLGSGHGSRFASLAAGEYYYALMVDESHSDFDANWQIVKVTARSSDTLTITAAQEGTTDKNFPIGGVGQPQQVKVTAILSERQLRMMSSGFGAKIQATAPSLDADSPEVLVLTPTANITLTLPTTNVWAGKRFVVLNLATAYTVAIQSSEGNAILTLPFATTVTLVALQDEPTAAADWGIPATFFPDGFRFGTAGTATHKGAGIPRDSTGALLTQTTTVTLAGAGGPTSGVLQTFTLPANSLSENGKFVIAKAWGTKTGTNAAFSIQFRVGTTSVGTATNFTLTAAMNWHMFLLLVRTSAGNQKYGLYAVPPRDDTGSVTLCGTGTMTKDETTNLAIDYYCTTKHTNDVVTGEILAPILFG